MKSTGYIFLSVSDVFLAGRIAFTDAWVKIICCHEINLVGKFSFKASSANIRGGTHINKSSVNWARCNIIELRRGKQSSLAGNRPEVIQCFHSMSPFMEPAVCLTISSLSLFTRPGGPFKVLNKALTVTQPRTMCLWSNGVSRSLGW